MDFFVLNRGSNMSAHVLFGLLNKLKERLYWQHVKNLNTLPYLHDICYGHHDVLLLNM